MILYMIDDMITNRIDRFDMTWQILPGGTVPLLLDSAVLIRYVSTSLATGG